MSHGTQNGGLPNWARFVIGAAVVLVVIFVAPWLWRQYEDTGAQSERIAELKDDKAQLTSQLTAAQSELSELRLELRLAQQEPTTPLEPLPNTWPPPSTLDTTQPDQLDQLDQALTTLERIQEAQARLEKLVETRPDLTEDPAFVQLLADLTATRNDVAAVNCWALKVAGALRKQAAWIVAIARKCGYEPTTATGPGVPADYRVRTSNEGLSVLSDTP